MYHWTAFSREDVIEANVGGSCHYSNAPAPLSHQPLEMISLESKTTRDIYAAVDTALLRFRQV